VNEPDLVKEEMDLAPEDVEAELGELGEGTDENLESTGEQEGEVLWQEGDPEALERQVPEEMSQMLFVDVSLVLPSTYPVVILQEADAPYRELRIPVGGAEGVAIGYAARQVDTPRPLTHEMFSHLLDAFDLNLDAVRITSLEGANFIAELQLSGPSGVRTVDCRPSDAIALCLRRALPVPIMVATEVLEQAGGGAATAN
jgi:bifunctional DNase/RNase